ncbi:TOBE domain protein [anaerobic digester metagenome]
MIREMLILSAKIRSIMKISARNQIKGVITEIKSGVVTARVILDIGGGNRLSSVITMESVQELNLKPGDEVYAIIKSTEVMIGKE